MSGAPEAEVLSDIAIEDKIEDVSMRLLECQLLGLSEDCARIDKLLECILGACVIGL